MKTTIHSICLAIALFSAGCIETAGDESPLVERAGESELAAVTMNGLHAASVRTAKLTNNRDYRDALVGNALTAETLSEPVKALLLRDAASDELMSYVVACALEGGDELRIAGQQGARVYHGADGVAAGWRDGACGASCREWVSACVLAHTNYLGEHVRINLVATPFMPESDYADYPHPEASYWGDIFAAESDQKRFACVDDRSRLQRVCGPDTTSCGGYLRGGGPAGEIAACATTCARAMTDGGQPNSACFAGCAAGGGSSDATIAVWRSE